MDSHISLSQLVDMVSDSFRMCRHDTELLVIAEVSKISLYKTRAYIDLVEIGDHGKILAKARGIIYDSSIYRAWCEAVSIDDLSSIRGFKLLIRVRVSFHSEYGFALYITYIDPHYTAGQLQHKQQDIFTILQSEGVAGHNLSLQLADPPYRIAIISSAGSQGYTDFITILDQSDYHISHTLYHTSIHGNEAQDAVYQTFKQIYRDIHQGQLDIDAIAIVRGGGGSSGILWQNDLNIARAVCHMPVPVIIAVGHTSDRYILDQICRYPSSTPSDAAHQLIDIYTQIDQQIISIYTQIQSDISTKISHIYHDIDMLYKLIEQNIHTQINQIISHISSIYAYISSLDLSQMHHRGRATLHDTHDKLLSKSSISQLGKGDTIYIHIYNQHIAVQVLDQI